MGTHPQSNLESSNNATTLVAKLDPSQNYDSAICTQQSEVYILMEYFTNIHLQMDLGKQLTEEASIYFL